MAKWIKYNICAHVNHGTDEKPEMVDALFPVTMGWNEENEELARREAHNGKYAIVDDGVEENTAPTQLDILEAQVTYTAMMTDTLLEVQSIKEKIAKWYRMGLWTEAMVHNAAAEGVLTEAEVSSLTGGYAYSAEI